MDHSKIHNYIVSQLNTGLSPQDIVTQLRQAGWDDTSIQAAFSSVAATLNNAPSQPTTPTQQTQQTQPTQQVFEQPVAQPVEQPEVVTANPVETMQPSTPQTLPAPLKKSRLKLGWLLLKQSLNIIKSSPQLIRYVVLSMVITIALELVFIGLIAADVTWWHTLVSDTTASNVTFYIGLYVFMILITFVTYFFTVALSANVLSIFRGTPSTFADNIAIARQKLHAIVIYTLIATTVGFILRQIEERFQLLGRIISFFLGALWSLLTTFTLPIIADTDKSGVNAVKESFHLFKANWGQTIVSRVGLGGMAVLFYLLIIIPVTFVLTLLCAPLGFFGLLIPLSVFVITMIALSIVITMATSILNVCLYYYAKYQAIPPSFDAELLASVFVEKKQKNKRP